jgi:RimJ/RimL family protein N-acetyltransferase
MHVTGPIHFRRIAETDLPMATEWLHRPHVAAWWDDQTSLEQVRAKYLPRLTENYSVVPYLAYRSGRPIGYIQSYVPALEGDGWWPDVFDPGVRGIDQFLADEANLSQGLGSAMVTAFVRTLFEDPAVTRIQTDPSPRNPRAIRSYEKAGFQRVGLVDTPNGQALLMVFDRPGAVFDTAA